MVSQALTSLSLFGRKKVPMIHQAELSECGLACLCMISQYHGNRQELSSFRQKFGISTRGMTLQSIMKIADESHFTTRAVKLELEDLHQLQLPAILHWDMQHFVVLTRVTDTTITVNDPAVGERTLTFAQASGHVTGIALEVTPGANFEAKDPGPSLTLSHFWEKATGLKRSLGLILALSVLLQLFALASPYYMQTVIDDVLLRGAEDLLLVLALGFFLLLIIESATSLLREWVILGLSSKLQLQISGNLFQHLLRLPSDFFAKRHLGDIVSRFGSLAQIREQLTTGLVTALLDGVMTLLMILVMWLYSPTLTVVVLLSVLAFTLVRLVTYRTLKALSTEELQNQAKEQSHFMESMRSIQTIKQLNYQSQRHNQWSNHLTRSLNTSIRIGKRQMSISVLNQLIFGIENILVIYFAAHSVMDTAMTVGMLYAFISYKTKFTGAAANLINHLIQLRLLRVHLARLADIVFTSPEVLDTALPARAENTACRKGLVVSQLSYRFSSTSAAVFENINLTVSKGATVAIVGASGAGKSTLLKCLMGLLTPDTGNVSYQGHAVSQSAWFREHSASVLQDDACLSGTIFDNLTGFDDTPCHQRMQWAAHMACLDADIAAMPMQYQTLIGDMGSALSGGQQQRLLLARALYRQPEVLFLDEASSHLDVINEAKINQNLKSLSITRIIVAHRPETIAMADEVYLLQNGGLARIEKPQHQAVPVLTPQGETYA